MRKEFVVLSCTFPDGSPAMTIHPVNVSEAQYEMGDHHAMAIFEAEELGFKGPFKCFDNGEHDQILSIALALKKLLRDGEIEVD